MQSTRRTDSPSADPVDATAIGELRKAEVHLHLEGCSKPQIWLLLPRRMGSSCPDRPIDCSSPPRSTTSSISCHGRARSFGLGTTCMLRRIATPNELGVVVSSRPTPSSTRATGIRGMTTCPRCRPRSGCAEPGRAPLPQNAVRYQAGFAAVLVGIGLGAVAAAAPFVRDCARPWPSAGVDTATDDPMVRRLCGDLVTDSRRRITQPWRRAICLMPSNAVRSRGQNWPSRSTPRKRQRRGLR